MALSRHPLLSIALVLLAGVSSAAPRAAPAADDPRQTLRQVQSDIQSAQKRKGELTRQAEALAGEIDATTRNMVALAEAIQQREKRLSQLEGQLTQLKQRHDAQMTLFIARQQKVSQLLAALQTLSRRPPSLLFFRPASALETARSASLLATVLPMLNDRLAALRTEISALNASRAALEQEQARYRGELTGLAADRAKLEELRRAREAQRGGLLAQAADETQKLERMARQARDIQDLLARLEVENRRRERLARLTPPTPRPAGLAARLASPADKASSTTPVQTTKPAPARPAPPPAVAMLPPQSAAPQAIRGNFRLPVEGSLVQRFGAALPAGGSSKGLLIRTRSDAQVVAPYGGRVVFAGPFRGYGLLLIIAHGGGYHSLLAGMSRLDEQVGASVQAGEPIGVMGATDQQGPELYLEVRQRGTPVNPLPWLASVAKRTEG